MFAAAAIVGAQNPINTPASRSDCAILNLLEGLQGLAWRLGSSEVETGRRGKREERSYASTGRGLVEADEQQGIPA